MMRTHVGAAARVLGWAVAYHLARRFTPSRDDVDVADRAVLRLFLAEVDYQAASPLKHVPTDWSQPSLN